MKSLLLRPIDCFLLVWFVLTAASTLYVAIDRYRNNPDPAVMKWGFILVRYTGPFGLLIYVLAAWIEIATVPVAASRKPKPNVGSPRPHSR
jgi:cytochrome c oxidase subunit IV